MLELASGLSSPALRAIAELEQEVTEADGGRLKLEWATLRHRTGDRVEDVLWWEGDRLLGFLGIYGFEDAPELAGMVAPDARRRGIGSALLEAGIELCRERRGRDPLLIVPRHSSAGKRLALGRGGTLDHSEHALALTGDVPGGPSCAGLSLRPAGAADLPRVAELLALGFGQPAPVGLAERLDSPTQRTAIVELDGSSVGTLRVERNGDHASIYGFVVDPARQGRGIGRGALRLACEQLRADGAARIGLEVDVENDRALSLYTSVGFTPVVTEDYYAMPLS